VLKVKPLEKAKAKATPREHRVTIDVAQLLFAGAVSRIGKPAVPLALAVILLGCSQAAHKNVCPIDGQPPQWSGARNGQSCEYFHYSIVEKKTHSWWSDCPTPQ